MKKLMMGRAVALGAAVALACVFGASDASAAPTKLLGKWKAVKTVKGGKTRKVPQGLTVIAHFKKGGTFISHLSYNGRMRSQAGTWTVKGKVLTTKIKTRVETMRFKIAGKTLRLTKVKKPEHLYMVRADGWKPPKAAKKKK